MRHMFMNRRVEMQGGEVRIRLSVGGVEVELECSEDQVERVVREVLRGLRASSDVLQSGVTQTRGQQVPATCRDVIEGLWKQGWMARPRALGEVYDEMSRKGYHYDRSAISHALLDLVKEGKLTRQGKARRYRYVQKTPIDQVINVKST